MTDPWVHADVSNISANTHSHTHFPLRGPCVRGSGRKWQNWMSHVRSIILLAAPTWTSSSLRPFTYIRLIVPATAATAHFGSWRCRKFETILDEICFSFEGVFELPWTLNIRSSLAELDDHQMASECAATVFKWGKNSSFIFKISMQLKGKKAFHWTKIPLKSFSYNLSMAKVLHPPSASWPLPKQSTEPNPTLVSHATKSRYKVEHISFSLYAMCVEICGNDGWNWSVVPKL